MMTPPHYELNGLERRLDSGRTVYQIRATVDVPGTARCEPITAGDIGGWIESIFVMCDGEQRYRLADNAWVAEDACVYEDARLEGSARVSGAAQCSGRSIVRDEARVAGNARVSHDAWVWGHAEVSGQSIIFDDAQVYGYARVDSSARVFGNANLEGACYVTQRAQVFDDAYVNGHADVRGRSRIFGDAHVGGSVKVSGNASVGGYCSLYGFGRVTDDARIAADGDGITIDAQYDIAGAALIESNRHLLVANPIGPRETYAVFYRTATGTGEVSHYFEGPWRGSLEQLAVDGAAATARWSASQTDKTMWNAQFAAFARLAAASEAGWQKST
jgi:acyl-[acyl carrier protein]--UDP-N-acetylglucosamine O-acyltransferase